MQYDFDQVVDRTKNLSAKYDERVKKFGTDDVIPLWIADMDFRTAQPVIDALKARAEEGIWGYTARPASYFEAVKNWQKRRNGWDTDTALMSFSPGVVQTLSVMIRLYTPQNGNVLIQTPVYGEFYDMTELAGRHVIENQLVEQDGAWTVDWADFEEKLRSADIFLLCNPHNPLGIVWTEEELRRMMELCLKHHVLVVSDEIHADFVFEGKHQVFADLKPEYKDFTVICTSPGKTFNIAGLQASNILIPNEALREAFAKQITAAGYSQISAPGIEAVIAAYAQGEEWYQEMKKYVGENITFLHEWMEEHIPQIKVTRTEGTYLVWMDFRGLGIAEENLKDFVENRAGLWLDGGKMFGESGSGFQRINVACPRKTLEKALTQLETAVKNL